MRKDELQMEAFKAVRLYFNHLLNDEGLSYQEANELLKYTVEYAKQACELRYNYMKRTEEHM